MNESILNRLKGCVVCNYSIAKVNLKQKSSGQNLARVDQKRFTPLCNQDNTHQASNNKAIYSDDLGGVD